MGPCKSRRRLRPMVSLLRQGFPFPAACQAEEVTLLYRHWQLPVQTQVRGYAGGASCPEGSSEVST
jgi:hypothetical protein